MALACANHPDVVTGLQQCSRCDLTYCGDCVINLAGKPVCSACKPQNVLDIRSGRGDGLDLAGRGSRLLAQIIDGFVYMLFFMLGCMLFGILLVTNRNNPALIGGLTIMLYLVLFSLIILYEGLMLTKFGATLGKMAVGVHVVQNTGQPLTTGRAWGRSLSRILLSVLPVVSLVDILMIFSEKRSCLHDLIASTAVIKKTLTA